MKIKLEDLYLGAALIQIAKDKHFTAINSLKIKSDVVKNAYKINDSKALFCKYGEKPNTQGEYQFNFTEDHIAAIKTALQTFESVYIAFCCVEVAEICCITGNQFSALLSQRASTTTKKENSLTILVTAEENKSFRVYVNAAGRRGFIAGNEIVISRNKFPSLIF